jgi:hypothetical protein
MQAHFHGAVGAGVLALAVVLVAVPGPVTALTLVSVKGALGGALAELLAATGVGAVFGKRVKHLTSVIQEKLLGSPEFAAVQDAATDFHRVLEEAGLDSIGVAVDEAEALIMPADDPLVGALETLRQETEMIHD